MKKYGILVIACLFIISILFSSVPCFALIILDQENLSNNVWAGTSRPAIEYNSPFRRAQTFTVGVEGMLDSIEVWLHDPLQSGAELRILPTIGGFPTIGSTFLAISTQVSSLGDFHRFDLTSADLEVHVGDVLAIELFSPNPIYLVNMAWWSGNNNPYLFGSDFYYNPAYNILEFTANLDADMSFRTFVDTAASVPEPATMLLLGSGLLGLWGFRRKFKK